jgi:phenylacetate-CoA ligase
VSVQVHDMPRALLDAQQWARMREQIASAAQSPFYAERLARAGIAPGDIHEPADVTRIPVTRKADVCDDVAAHPPYGSRLVVDSGDVVSVVETSGTSGKGREVHVATADDLRRIIAMESEGFAWAGIRSATVVVLTIPTTMTAASTWWSLALNAMGANWLRVGTLSSTDKLRYAQRYHAEVLIATPTYLTRLEHAALQMGLDPRTDLPSLRSVVVAGEARSPAWTAEREQVWGATVYEQWGCTQGAVAWACENGMARSGVRGMLHFLPHLEWMEVIDPQTGAHVADGDLGELVVTPLGVSGAPLIRFATGDRVRFRAASTCSCGRPFDGIEAGSVSRYDDMVKVKGVNVWPSAVDALIDEQAAITEHRVTIAVDDRQREVITVELQFDPGTSAQQRQDLAGGLRPALHSVTGLHVDIIEWTGDGDLADEVLHGTPWKARRWRDLRGA